LSGSQRRIIEILAEHPQGLSVTKLKKTAGRKSILDEIKGLQGLQFINVGDRIGKATVTKKQETRVAIRSPLPPDVTLTEKQKKICEFLERHGETDMSRLRSEFKNVRATITSMEKKGLLDISTREVYRSPAPPPHIGEENPDIRLNEQQEKALGEIVEGSPPAATFPVCSTALPGAGRRRCTSRR